MSDAAQWVFGEMVKQHRDIEIWGVEPIEVCRCRGIRPGLNRVVVGTFCPQTALPEEFFDCIVFNDVLEHMAAPEQALRYAKSLLSPTRMDLWLPIPNVRYLPILWRLAARGGWEYGDCGVLDRTHRPFFYQIEHYRRCSKTKVTSRKTVFRELTLMRSIPQGK